MPDRARVVAEERDEDGDIAQRVFGTGHDLRWTGESDHHSHPHGQCDGRQPAGDRAVLFAGGLPDRPGHQRQGDRQPAQQWPATEDDHQDRGDRGDRRVRDQCRTKSGAACRGGVQPQSERVEGEVGGEFSRGQRDEPRTPRLAGPRSQDHADDEGDDQHRPRAVLVRQPAARRGRSARAPARCRWPVSHRPSLGAPKRL